jgi:peroxiredoxin Q/BCP
MLTEGSKAPDFTLPDDQGNKVSLKSLRGKKVVLFVYPKDNTPGCTQESCDFRDNYAKFQKKNVVVLGLSKDNVASKQKFKAKFGFPYPLLADEDQSVLQAYDLIQDKNMYGKKVKGIVRTTFIIDEDGKIARIFSKVKVPGHVDEVLAAL